MLPYGKIILSTPYRALGDGTIERLNGGVWSFYVKRPTHKGGRESLDAWAKDRAVPTVGA